MMELPLCTSSHFFFPYMKWYFIINNNLIYKFLYPLQQIFKLHKHKNLNMQNSNLCKKINSKNTFLVDVVCPFLSRVQKCRQALTMQQKCFWHTGIHNLVCAEMFPQIHRVLFGRNRRGLVIWSPLGNARFLGVQKQPQCKQSIMRHSSGWEKKMCLSSEKDLKFLGDIQLPSSKRMLFPAITFLISNSSLLIS